MTIAIVSLGQLISSNVATFKKSFELALKSEGKETTGDAVWAWLQDYLPRLRRSQMTFEELHDEFIRNFDSSMPFEDFMKNFNSMCLIDEPSLQRISEINALLSDHRDIQLLIVSHTNVSHLEYIMNQLERVVPTCKAGILNSSTNNQPPVPMIFATSMASQCEHHPDTLKWALDRLQMDLDQPIISFLNTVQHLDGAANFAYIAIPTLTAEHIIEHAIELHGTHSLNLGF